MPEFETVSTESPPIPPSNFTLSFPISQNIGEALLFTVFFVALCAGIYASMPTTEARQNSSQFDTQRFIRVLAIVLSPVWVLIGGYILWNMIQLAATQAPTSGTELRWHILAFLGLVTALGATVSAPLALIRVITTERQTRTAEQGHITDRISAAVEQLGAEKVVKVPTDQGTTAEKSERNIEVRIGGLLSLERIAQDSTRNDQGRDHVRVMEIICAYIRENAPASGAEDYPLPDWEPLAEDADEPVRKAHEMWWETRFPSPWDSNARQWAQALDAPHEDIKTALNILKRRTSAQRKVEANRPGVEPSSKGWVYDETTFNRLPDEPSETALSKDDWGAFKAGLEAWKARIQAYEGYKLDLRHTNLQGADLSRAEFSGALLIGARMEGAKLGQARMEGANLFGARLEGAYLAKARTEGANLGEARMEGANLGEARMEGAYLAKARMEGAILAKARMEGANLGEARMEGANLIEARMEGAGLGWARMEGADLDEARMEGAILYEARMEGAYLVKARMEGAILNKARMAGAILSWARFDKNTSFQAARWKDVTLTNTDLAQDQINASFGDGSVILPEGLDWPTGLWPKEELDWGDYDKAYKNWLKTHSP